MGAGSPKPGPRRPHGLVAVIDELLSDRVGLPHPDGLPDLPVSPHGSMGALDTQLVSKPKKSTRALGSIQVHSGPLSDIDCNPAHVTASFFWRSMSVHVCAITKPHVPQAATLVIIGKFLLYITSNNLCWRRAAIQGTYDAHSVLPLGSLVCRWQNPPKCFNNPRSNLASRFSTHPTSGSLSKQACKVKDISNGRFLQIFMD